MIDFRKMKMLCSLVFICNILIKEKGTIAANRCSRLVGVFIPNLKISKLRLNAPNLDNQTIYIVRFGYTIYRTKTYFSYFSLHINPNYDVLHCNLHNFRYFEDCNHVVHNPLIRHKRLHIRKPSNPFSCYISFCIPQHLYPYTRLSCDHLHTLSQCTDNFPLQVY